MRHEDAKGHAEWLKITSFAVEVISVHQGEIRSEQNYYLIRHYKPHDGWRAIDLPASKLIGPMAIATMADIGVVVHDYDLFRQFVRESVDFLNARERTRMQYEQFGWKDDNAAFLYGDRLYRPQAQEPVACSSELRFRAQWLRPTPGGSVEAWKAAADNLMGLGSEGMSFTILCSFGAPLMRFLEDNEGGAIVHLMTKHSGAGKTTSLAGAYTVWASDPRAIALSSFDTKVSKFVALGAMCNLPVVFDEFENKDPFVIRELVMVFTGGRDKMRSDSAGNIIHAAASWQTMLISAANKSLVELIMSTGESEAPAFRVLEFPVESAGQLTISEAARYKKQLEENAGHAGDAFVRYLVRPEVLAWAKAHMSSLADEIFKQGGFRKEHRYWVRALAAAGTAAVIVQKLNLISFEPKRVMAWAIQHFAKKVQAQHDRGSLLPMLGRFLNDFLGETLVMPGPSQGRKAMPAIGDRPKYRITVRSEIEGASIYITDFVFRDWMAKNGGGYAEIMSEMQEKGILRSARRSVTLTAGTELRGGQVIVFEIDGDHPALTGTLRAVMDEAPLDSARNTVRRADALEPSKKPAFGVIK